MRSPIAGPRLAALFALLTAVPLVAMAWLGWRVAEQDRTLERQRLLDRLQQSDAVLVHEFDRTLAVWDDRVRDGIQGDVASLPPNLALVVFNESGVVRTAGLPLPFYPAIAASGEPARPTFDAAEADEFRPGGDPTRAEAIYQRLVTDADPATRAGALMRLARCLSRDGHTTEALTVYTQLAALGGVPVAGAPAALVARRERLRLLTSRANPAAATAEATALASVLKAGEFRIDRPTFDVYAAAAGPLALDRRAEAMAETAEAMWSTWERDDQGREVFATADGPILSVWQHTPAGAAALVGPVDEFIAGVEPVAKRLAVGVAIDDSSDYPLWGPTLQGPVVVASPARQTGLPWSVRVAPTDGLADGVSRSRATAWAAGFVLMSVVVIAASYVGYRAVNRELDVARLQSEFVATVSHEFRTPLTAMRHLTEVLEDGRAAPDRVPDYYRALARETRRLHAMVENLLDFGRLEAGRREYHRQETDAAELARHVVEELGPHTAGHRVTIEAAGRTSVVADRDALALALRNLVDNAIKYSAADRPVTVSVARRGDAVDLSVEDRGPGISLAEQRRLFRKFVRGAAAAQFEVKGTGLGLAMVDHIVRAHGGRLELSSEVGVGSRFSILLPAQEA